MNPTDVLWDDPFIPNYSRKRTMLRPYPDSLPADTWGVVFDALKGNLPDKNHAVHCAYEAAGFALGKVMPDAAPIMFAAMAAQVDGEKAIWALAGNHTVNANAAFPWASVLAAVLKLLQDLLGRP